MSSPNNNDVTIDDATADDLIFLLSIVGNPNRIIAEQENEQQSTQQQDASTRSNNASKVSKSIDKTPSESWQSVLATLPSQRRQLIMALHSLANSYQEWSQQALTGNDGMKDGNQDYSNLEVIGKLLEKIEEIASNLRKCIAQYLEYLQDYKHSIHLFWIQHIDNNNNYDDISQLSQIGYQLASQLLNQLSWDEHLVQNSIIQLLNEELYTPNNETDIIHKLNTWASAISSMIVIDKSFWKFVEREVYDETELDNNNEDAQLLNGEASSEIVDIDTLINSLQGEHMDIDDTNDNSCEDVSKQTMSLHECILKSRSVEEAVQEFFNYSPPAIREMGKLCKGNRKIPLITSILVKGQEGCGKTHLLDTIQRQQRQQSLINRKDTDTSKHNHQSSSVRIIRPKYPVDLVGNSIGSSEDRMITLFAYANEIITTCRNNTYTKCLVMLDDLDKILSLSDNTNTSAGVVYSGNATNSAHYFVGRRFKALFLSIVDSLRVKDSSAYGHILLLCTSRGCEEIISRFDRVFVKRELDSEQRRDMIVKCLSPENCDEDNRTALEQEAIDDDDELLSRVVHHATGKSAFELSQCCRKALLLCAETSPSQDESGSILRRRLTCLDNMMQVALPPSLRGGSLDGVVDMKVITSEELLARISTRKEKGNILLPLFGGDAKRAYESLMNVVITPFCHSNDIVELLYGGGNAVYSTDNSIKEHTKPIKVGALLTGEPGVGKTSLAYHCASIAASMSRGMTLLDVSCTSLIHKELGGSERAVQQLFNAVRAASPCILLLDGIENIAPCRGNDNTSEGTMDRVLSMFLTEMDGIETGKSAGNVAVIGITYDANLIDPSIRRPGRLEKTISLGMPDTEARKELVLREIKSMNLDFSLADYFDPKNEEELSKFVAIESAGMSAVEVIAICKEASMECLREVDFKVTDPNVPPSLKYNHFKSAVNKMKGRRI